MTDIDITNRAEAERHGQDPEFEQGGDSNFIYLSLRKRPEPRVGIFMKGSCDLPAMYVMAPLVRERLRQNGAGSCCIHLEGNGASDSRPDVLLQSLEGLPPSAYANLVDSEVLAGAESSEESGLNLTPAYFEPRLFEPTFTIPDRPGIGAFPKSVVALSVAPGLARSAYRHRTLGYVVDPGGFWLNESLDKVLSDSRRAVWFKDNFKSIGKLSVDDFYESFGRIVQLVRERTGAHVLVMSSLVVDPRNPLHNFQFVRNSLTVRRRRFDVALRHLSRELGFPIIDVDRILKREDIQGQVDAGHFITDRAKPIAEEAFRIITDLGVL